MPIQGTFLADFESFYAASQKAVVSLTSFESGGAKVERQLNRAADAFSGKKIIQDATLMARVFHDAGGAATFTTAELRRMGVVGAEAMEKLRRSGQPIPEQLMAMGRATRDHGTASRDAVPHVNNLRGSFQAFDGVLRAAGINMGREIAGLADLSEASGKTAAQLGGVATAGLAVGAGIGGWKIGRAISEFFDLDKTIGDATATLLGWGDVAGQEAAAGQDVLARATKTAGYEITSMAEAMRVNEAEAQRMIAANIKNSATLKTLADDAANAATIIDANRLKLNKVEHDFAVAGAARAAGNDAAYAGMRRDSTAAIAKAEADATKAKQDEYNGWFVLAAAHRAAGLPPPSGYPGFANGVENFRGGAAIVGERGPELVTLPRGSNVTPFGGGGGGDAPIHVYISGVFDPASSQSIAKVVSHAQSRRVMTARRW